MMRVTNILFAIALVFLSTGCYAEMRGTVVDADTGKPIEGAVVLAEWTKTQGLGLTHTKSVQVIERTTDAQGIFIIPSTFNLLSKPPNLTIYKKGYVAWNNKYIFPDYSKRVDFQWQKENLFKMEKFKDDYSFIKHESFVDGAIHLGMASENKQLFLKAYNDGEREKVISERRKRDELRRIMKERKK